MVVLSWFWLAGWQNPAHPACGGSGRAGRREQEQHCGMRGRTAGQLRPHLGSGPLAWPLGSGHCWPGPLAAGTAGPCWGRGSARASGALEPTEPTFLPEPAPESPGLDTLKLWCSLFLSVGCYAEATRITTKTADD